jgi:hypothetical protein
MKGAVVLIMFMVYNIVPKGGKRFWLFTVCASEEIVAASSPSSTPYNLGKGVI